MAEFRYNALGQRTHKISAQGTTTFLYGPDGQLLGEQQFNSQGSKLTGQYYIWLDSMPLGGVSITFNSQGAIASSEPFYLHSDHLNTPRMATNQTQQNVWQWQSDAFGVGQASGTLAMNLRFPGQYFDQESGLYYNYFRDYDPETGRYVESDPIGLEGGLNTFGYVEGNPVNAIDPYGLAAEGAAVGGAIGAIGGGAAGAIAGGVGGTFVIPGFGTVGGATLGAAEGALWGAAGGAAAGSLIQDVYNWCTTDDDEEEDSDNCNAMYQAELSTCRALGRAERAGRVPSGSAATCYSSAEARFWACKNKRPLPPFTGWPQH